MLNKPIGVVSTADDPQAGELTHAGGRLEEPVRAGALGMHDALRDPLAVEVRELLDEHMVLQQDRTRLTGGQRVLVVRDRDPELGRQTPRARAVAVMGHSPSPCRWS